MIDRTHAYVHDTMHPHANAANTREAAVVGRAGCRMGKQKHSRKRENWTLSLASYAIYASSQNQEVSVQSD